MDAFLHVDECWSLLCRGEMCPVWVEAGGSRCVSGVWIWGRMSRCGFYPNAGKVLGWCQVVPGGLLQNVVALQKLRVAQGVTMG